MDDDEYIPSWNGQRTSTPDRLAGCTFWFLGLVAIAFFLIVAAGAIEAFLKWI